MTDAESTTQRRNLSGTEITAIAHLYRGEIYRSTTWRTRLDTTTNWAVVTLGVALSITFASPAASPMPLILVGVLILLFLWLEARRYRYFNVWRARALAGDPFLRPDAARWRSAYGRGLAENPGQ